MEVKDIISELRNETERLNKAIAALEDIHTKHRAPKHQTPTKATTGANIQASSMGKQTR
jgi:hypothetical protein